MRYRDDTQGLIANNYRLHLTPTLHFVISPSEKDAKPQRTKRRECRANHDSQSDFNHLRNMTPLMH